MDIGRATALVDNTWESTIIPTLSDYIRIPNKSPAFDPQWAEHGYMDEAIALLKDWCEQQPIKNMHMEIVRLEGRTPVLFIEIEGSTDDTVLLYGHYDKQPEFSGWAEGLEPWKPVRSNGKLYGRGGADDGYAVFSSLTAIRVLQEQGIDHGRCVILIEGCEESGSFDLPHYVEALHPRIGEPSLVVCLDAECGDYDRLWITTSLRGNLVGTLTAEVLTEGVHSGLASGVVASSFRVARALLSRLEDEATGRVNEALWGEIPAARVEQAQAAAALLGPGVVAKIPWAGDTQPVTEDPVELLLNSTWRPTLCVTGAAGLPTLDHAGNTLRPMTALKLSFRLPPNKDPEAAAAAVTRLLTEDPPYGARVSFQVEQVAAGWDAPAIAPWLAASMSAASQEFFNADVAYMGTGGTIPFMPMLGEAFPGVQFIVTGVLGPKSNAHGPNEFLHLDTAKKLTGCVSRILADHAARR
jgi:acetylornithine deacetylase/succinyl-diaminopimelate desuccinylase-like protein